MNDKFVGKHDEGGCQRPYNPLTVGGEPYVSRYHLHLELELELMPIYKWTTTFSGQKA